MTILLREIRIQIRGLGGNGRDSVDGTVGRLETKYMRKKFSLHKPTSRFSFVAGTGLEFCLHKSDGEDGRLGLQVQSRHKYTACIYVHA
jgi:hypothetical protein